MGYFNEQDILKQEASKAKPSPSPDPSAPQQLTVELSGDGQPWTTAGAEIELFERVYPRTGLLAVVGLTGAQSLPVLRHLRECVENIHNDLPATAMYDDTIPFIGRMILDAIANPDSVWSEE